MTDEPDTTFRRGVVRPIECYKQGWALIKENYWLFLGIAFVAVLIAQVGPFGILIGPCMSGLYMCYFRMMDGEKPSFDLLFKGFDHFVQSLIATLLWMVPFMVVMGIGYFMFVVGMIASMPQNPAGPGRVAEPPWELFAGFGVFMLVVMLASVAAHLVIVFMYQLIVDRRLPGVQALTTSARAVGANFTGVLGLMALEFLASTVGACACYVGVIFVFPINFAATAVAYRMVFPKTGYVEPPDDDAPVNDA
jgi:uncharacterized membrane protein